MFNPFMQLSRNIAPPENRSERRRPKFNTSPPEPPVTFPIGNERDVRSCHCATPKRGKCSSFPQIPEKQPGTKIPAPTLTCFGIGCGTGIDSTCRPVSTARRKRSMSHIPPGVPNSVLLHFFPDLSQVAKAGPALWWRRRARRFYAACLFTGGDRGCRLSSRGARRGGRRCRRADLQRRRRGRREDRGAPRRDGRRGERAGR